MKLSPLYFVKKIIAFFSFGRVVSFWYRHYKSLFFLGFFMVVLLGGWRWYHSFYQYRLSDEEKKQYVEQYFKETTFNEKKFRDTVQALSERTRLHEEKLEIDRNIFEGKGIVPKE